MEERQVGQLFFSLDPSKPLYEQLVQQIQSYIAIGTMNPGDKIAAVREMAQALKINPNTVMRAYQELEREGLTEQRRGQGTFVTTDHERIRAFRSRLALETVDEFMEKMRNLGYSLEEMRRFIEEK
ncbi:GntR family transcriptional regulator [Aureibacillus halotolerans]|uniref:GntR family transcriptional regulator n=1 Tax=Aureibacillus halotolerans TaxID=1508390 RepID=A0A4R6U978_9BACI|nr:GntR family transcriptional regulator [Aureibacillus halotolerans]TDQ41225.1 GntR family transcriptional regulator [Aureibacillus halotolerans]